MASSDTTRAPNPARQERSLRTAERILKTTVDLLRRRPFEKITVAEIVRGAKSSVGSFYARFPDKESLLTALYEHYDRSLQDEIDELLAPLKRPRLLLRTKARLFIELNIQFYRQQQNLLRAIGLHSRMHPEILNRELLTRRKKLQDHAIEVFRPHLGEIDHPKPQRALENAFYFVAAVCRDKLLFAGPHARTRDLDDHELAGELTRVFLSYLGVT